MAADGPPAKKARKMKKPLEAVSAAADNSANCKFARALGSVDWHTREQGLQALTTWLSRNNVSEEDLTKIWKALFFCFWHSDKAPVQADLAERLAGILPQLSPEGGLLYFKVFARTMQREWFGIDRLRLDKFMLLARKFVHQLFALLRQSDWDSGRTAAFCQFLAEDVFARSDTEPSAGFSLHLADIAVPELCSACQDGPPVPPEALQAVLEPFCAALAGTRRPALAARLQDGVFGELLTRTSGAAPPGVGAPLAALDLRALGGRLFDLGAQAQVKARNREVLYALSRTFERAAARRLGKGADSNSGSALPAAAVAPQREGAVQDDARSAAVAAARAPAQSPVDKPGAAVAGKPALGQRQKKRKAPGKLVLVGTPADWPGKPPDAPASVNGPAASTPSLPPSSVAEEVAQPGASGKDAPPVGVNGRADPGPRAMLWAKATAKATAKVKVKGTPGKGKKRKLLASAEASGGMTAAAASSSLTSGVSEMASLAVSMPAASASGKATTAPPANGNGGAWRALLSPAMRSGMEKGASGGSVKTRLRQLQTARGTPLNGTPGMSESARKKVKFALKKNLYFAKGGPVPPADLRTPPTAQPKGSALKKSSLLVHRAPKSPRSIPRAKAAMFF